MGLPGSSPIKGVPTFQPTGVTALSLGPVLSFSFLCSSIQVLPGIAPPTSLRDWCHLSLYKTDDSKMAPSLPPGRLVPDWALQLVLFKVVITFS